MLPAQATPTLTPQPWIEKHDFLAKSNLGIAWLERDKSILGSNLGIAWLERDKSIFGSSLEVLILT